MDFLLDYGMDSPMAVELRELTRKQFQAIVAVFNIMSDTTVSEIGMLVMERLTYPDWSQPVRSIFDAD
ncbi:hypothetical protein F5X99DRAFT_399219 [Biscogniauxia marginata]|nr:hypothetical protein F5X99DRAFT_399219 [Biscogniauxia marginata]